MKKITLQLKSVANPKLKDKPVLGTAYLNILKGQPSTVKIYRPEPHQKSPDQTESSPKNIALLTQKTDRKPSNQIETEQILKREENKSTKTIHQPTIYTLNLNVEVEKPGFSSKNVVFSKENSITPIFQKEKISPAKNSKSPPEKKLASNGKGKEAAKNNNNIKDEIAFFCECHPTKRAKYFKINEDTLSSEENIERKYYCSKCAISFALKGVRVFDISNPEQLSSNELTDSSQRREMKSIVKNLLTSSDKNENNDEEEIKLKRLEIESFVAELETVQNSGVNSMTLLTQKRKEMVSFYEKQTQKIQETFKTILENLEKSKKSILDKLKVLFEENEYLINNYQNQISNSLKDMNYIHSDISQNVSNIITTMDRKPFTIILSKYQQKLKNYELLYQTFNKENLCLHTLQVNLNNLQGKPFKLEEEIWKLVNPFNLNQSESCKNAKKNDKNFYISFDDKDAFEKSPASMDKNLTKMEKNTPLKILNTTSVSEKENLNSPNTQKYLKLLQKVSNNQENTNLFFNDVMKQNPLRSSESCKNFNVKELNRGEDKDFQKFFSKLEKKIETSETKINHTYQKHLFCSPHFNNASDN